MYVEVTFVLGVSTLLQFIAAFLALRLIRITGRRRAWVLIAMAVFLMALRRCIPLFRLISGNLTSPPDLPAELVGLAISGLVVAGIAWIAPLFLSVRRSEGALRESRRKIESLHEAPHRLEACENEEEVYRLTVEAAEKILNFSMCTLDIFEGNKLVVKSTSSGLPPDASRERDLDEDGLAAKTYRTGEAFVFGSLDEVPDARPTDSTFQSGISAPIGNVGVFQVVSREKNAFTEQDVRLLELLLGYTAQAIGRTHLQKRLRDQAMRDPLTGVYNRRYFNQVIEQEIERSTRYDHPIAFLMLDIDRFKKINDRYGHQVGDEVLQKVAKLLEGQVRGSDIVVRYGGDEFLLLLIETNGETETVKQRIIEEVDQWNKANPMFDFPVTLSIGSAHWSPEDERPVEKILAEADRKMYEEKRRRAEES